MKLFSTKIIVLFGVILISHVSKSQNIFSGEPVQIVGAFNGYATTPYNTDYRTTTYRRLSVSSGTPTDGRGQWFGTINVQSSGGNVMPINMAGGGGNGFLFISGPASNRFQNKWVFSNIGQGAINSLNDITAVNSGNDMGLDMSTAGYYSLVFNDVGYSTLTNSKYYVAYTTNAPVSVTRGLETLNSNGSVTVDINTSATPSSQENIYVRYTKMLAFSGNLSSTILQATGSGTNYSATIFPNGNGVYKYYVFTSTKTLAQLNASSEIDKSLQAIKFDDNNNSNYQFVNVLSSKLSKFEGKNNEKNVSLFWKNEDETNVYFYELMRSLDGTNFEKVASVSKNSNAQNGEYNFIDNYQITNKVFYKLAIVEVGGKKINSNIITLTNTTKNIFFAFPNPSNGFVTLQLSKEINGTNTANLFNNNGKLCFTKNVVFENGIGKMSVPASVSKGLYQLTINVNNTKYNLQLLIE